MSLDQCKELITLNDLKVADPRLAVEFVGDYDAYTFFLSKPIAAVKRLLPLFGVELGPQTLTPPGQHPIIFLAGRQSNVRPIAVSYDTVPCLTQLGLTMNYLEIIVAVPFVRRVAHPGLHTLLVCSTKLVLDRLGPTMLGWLCGFPKVVGRLSWQGARYKGKTLQSYPLLDATLKLSGSYERPDHYPNFAPVLPIFEQIHIGELLGMTVVCTQLDFQLSTVARICPIQGVAHVYDALCSIAVGNHVVSGIHQQMLGGFRLQTSWRLPTPQRCPQAPGP